MNRILRATTAPPGLQPAAGLAAGDDDRALETGLAVLVRGVVLLRRRHLDERGAARVLQEQHRVPVLRRVADEDLLGLARPQHLAAALFDHLRRGIAVLAVGLSPAGGALVG